MKEKIYDVRTGIKYVLVDDYYLPALKLTRTRPIGHWGMSRSQNQCGKQKFSCKNTRFMVS